MHTFVNLRSHFFFLGKRDWKTKTTQHFILRFLKKTTTTTKKKKQDMLKGILFVKHYRIIFIPIFFFKLNYSLSISDNLLIGTI